MECIINKPYPELKVKSKNEYYAKILLEDYSGYISELSAVTQYVYQFIDKFNIDKEFYDTIKQISIVEMKHLEILGKLIKLLGINPKFKSNYNNHETFWNTSYIDYNTDFTAILKNNIESEKKAINNYLYHISIIDDVNIKNILYRIIEDEQRHIACFNELLNKYKKD